MPLRTRSSGGKKALLLVRWRRAVDASFLGVRLGQVDVRGEVDQDLHDRTREHHDLAVVLGMRSKYDRVLVDGRVESATGAGG
jgi:hypothetical protein